MSKNAPKNQPIFAYAQLNARIMPIQRGELYETPLLEALDANGFGEVSGSGTMQQKTGEIEYCGIDINFFDIHNGPPFVCQFLNDRGAPKGSQLTYQLDGKDIAIPFGTREGLALYLNGTDLPPDVYKNSDVNFVIEECNRLLDTAGTLHGYWQGPTETALYFYGPSVTEMKSRLAPFLASYPLCQKSRLLQIA
jgi:hypothetical protein